MNNIDKQVLREAAANAKIAGEEPVMPFDQRITALNDFMKHCTPATVLALLDEQEAAEKRIAELEARTVILPERYEVDMCPTPSPDGEWYSREDILAALVSADVSYAAGNGKGE